MTELPTDNTNRETDNTNRETHTDTQTNRYKQEAKPTKDGPF